MGCNTNESQEHTFNQCEAPESKSELNGNYNGKVDNMNQQRVTIEVFMKINRARNIATNCRPGDTNQKKI